MSGMWPKVLMVRYSKTIYSTLLTLQFPINEEATDLIFNQEFNGAHSDSDKVSDCNNIIRVFHKHTELTIMAILASEALLRENKQSNDKMSHQCKLGTSAIRV